MINPSPKIPMGKQNHSQQGYQVRKKPIKLGSKLKEPQDQHRNRCCPNLNPNNISTGPYKGLDLKILLQGLKEDLDLPTVFVNGSNRGRSQSQVISQKDQDLLCLRGIDLNPSERVRAFLDGLGSSQFDHLISEVMTVLRNFQHVRPRAWRSARVSLTGC